MLFVVVLCLIGVCWLVILGSYNVPCWLRVLRLRVARCPFLFVCALLVVCCVLLFCVVPCSCCLLTVVCWLLLVVRCPLFVACGCFGVGCFGVC